MAKDDSKEQAAIDADQVIELAEDEHKKLPVEGEFDDALQVIELAQQPEVEADALREVAEAELAPQVDAEDKQVEAELAPQVRQEEEEEEEESDDGDETQASEAEVQKKSGSGIALPSFVERDGTDGLDTNTGIPLPPRAVQHDNADDSINDSADNSVSDNTDDSAKHFPTLQHPVASQHEDDNHKEGVVLEEITTEKSEIRNEFSNTHTGKQFDETGIDEEDILSARKLGAALTANDLFAFEPLTKLNEYEHLYQALLAVKGVWHSSVSMDELIVASARLEQSDRRVEEIKNWYAMRLKKLVVNVLDFCWVARAYEVDEENLLVIEDDQLFTSLTGLAANDFKELCCRGFINCQRIAALVQQFRLWEAETHSSVDYIFMHLRRERMVA